MASDTAPEAPPELAHGPFVTENVPSEYRSDEPTFARLCGGAGLFAVFLGSVILLMNWLWGPRALSPIWGMIGLVMGIALLMFHAARDGEVQFRRTYGIVGLTLALLGAGISLVPLMQGSPSAFYPWGFLGLSLGLLFLLPFGKHETDPAWKRLALLAFGAGGIALAGSGLVGGNFSPDFLLNPGLVLTILGLGYLWSAVGLLGSGNDRGYRLALLIGAIGFIALFVAVGRSLLQSRYFLPSGLLLAIVGSLYIMLAIGLASDSRIVALTRRELAAYFYSPIAYLVLFSMAVIGWLFYWIFVAQLLPNPGSMRPRTLPEPIVSYYIINIIPVFAIMLVVPALTMRLFSEERRTGTLEVLFTAPVDEVTVVGSKFLAALLCYLLCWLPWGFYLIALRVEGGTPFDYRPLLSFAVILVASGAAFVSMGLFFSALTRNQIIAAVLTAVGMILLLGLYLLRQFVPPDWQTALSQVSFVDQWFLSLSGKLYLRSVVAQLSVAAFWLFLTVKVLEARKWN